MTPDLVVLLAGFGRVAASRAIVRG